MTIVVDTLKTTKLKAPPLESLFFDPKHVPSEFATDERIISHSAFDELGSPYLLQMFSGMSEEEHSILQRDIAQERTILSIQAEK